MTAAMIPNKLYFRIGEVSHLTETKAHVLRYWEKEFPTLHPTKSRTGFRLYRRQDVETVFEIKRLLQQEGFTLQGARLQLAKSPRERAAEGVNGSSETSREGADAELLKLIKQELRAVLTILSSKC